MEAISDHKENHLGRGSIRADKSGPGASWRRHAPTRSFSRKKASSREDFSFLLLGQKKQQHACIMIYSSIPLEVRFRKYVFYGNTAMLILFLNCV